MTSNNINLLIVSLSCVLLSTHALRLTPNPEMAPSSAPSGEPTMETSEPQVVSFCTGTENPALCANTIASHMEDPQVDPVKALKTETEATLEVCLKISKAIKEDLAKPSLTKKERDALEVCKKEYESVQETIKETNVLLDQQNVADAYYKFSSVVSDNTECDDAVKELGVKVSFADDAFKLFQLGGNSLAIMDGIVPIATKLGGQEPYKENLLGFRERTFTPRTSSRGKGKHRLHQQ